MSELSTTPAPLRGSGPGRGLVIVLSALCLAAGASPVAAGTANEQASRLLPVPEATAASEAENDETADERDQAPSATRTAALDPGGHAASVRDDPARALPVSPPAEAEDAEPSGAARRTVAVAPPDAVAVGSCLPGSLKARLREIGRRWGKVEVISTHRPGARVAGTGRRSRHADCRAVDFRPAAGEYAEVAKWLKANHDGGVGTYSGRHNHIHIDNGPRYRWHN